MPDLSFTVESAESVPFAAAPTLVVQAARKNAEPDETIHTVVLRARSRLKSTRRRYSDAEKASCSICSASRTLEPDAALHAVDPRQRRYSRRSPAAPWPICRCLAPSISMSPPPNISTASRDGEIPLNLLFSGTVFYARPDGTLQVAPIPWDKETRFRLPVAGVAKA